MTVLATDTFTDTIGVLLPAHPSDSGHTWIKSADSDPTGDISISATGTRATCNVMSASARTVLAADPPTADYTVSADIHNVNATINNYPSLWIRALAASTDGYQVFWVVTTDLLVLRRNVAGVTTDVASGTLLGATSDATVSADVAGAVITVKVDGTTLFTYTDGSPIVATGRGGISFFTSGSGNAQFLDNFVITYTGVGPGASAGGMIHHLRAMGAY